MFDTPREVNFFFNGDSKYFPSNHKGCHLRNGDHEECSCCRQSSDRSSVSGLCVYFNV